MVPISVETSLSTQSTLHHSDTYPEKITASGLWKVSPVHKIPTKHSISTKQLVNKQRSKYDRSHKMCHYFLMTGSIHYPSEQGAVQEVTFPKFFQNKGERINKPVNSTKHKKKTANEKPDVKRRCNWKKKKGMRLKIQHSPSFVDNHSPKMGLK